MPLARTLPREAAAGEPYWWQAEPPRRPTPSTVTRECDVAVIGAGYAGLAAALTLARAGRTVQVFDRQHPGAGASTRNGGIASGSLRMSFARMCGTLGLARASRLYEESRQAREDLAHFIASEAIACDFLPVGRFTGAVGPVHYEALAREAELLAKHVGLPVHAISRAEQHGEVGSDFYHGGVVQLDIGGLHPAKLHRGMLRRALSAGALVHAETPVRGIARQRAHFELDTAAGRVKARGLVVTTNGYTDGVDRWLRRRLVPVQSRIIATDPLPAAMMQRLLPKARMMGETRRLYHYYRPSPDGSRILFGGRDLGSASLAGHANTLLLGRLQRIFPELAGVGISHAWSGNVAYNRDFLPRLFVRDGIHYAVGFCGSGVVWARWLGVKAARRLLGEGDAHSELACEPPRAVPLYNGRPWFLPPTVAWMALRDHFDRRRAPP